MNAHKELQKVFASRDSASIAIEINGFTGWRTTLLEELTDQEAQQLLDIHCPKPKTVDAEYNALKEDFIKKEWKSNILVLAERTKIKEKGSFHQFNNWMLTKSKFKKHLNAHTIDELKLLHQQLRAALQNNARSAQKTMTKAWWDKAESLKNYN